MGKTFIKGETSKMADLKVEPKARHFLMSTVNLVFVYLSFPIEPF